MPTVVLKRALTFDDGGRLFRRGIPQQVSDGDYLRLTSMGDFGDPTHEINAINPAYLRRAPAGTLIPVIRTGGLGDVLMAAVAVRAAAAHYPTLRFAYYTGADFVQLFQGVPWAHTVDELGNLRGRQNWVVDLRGYSERQHRERKERIGVFLHCILNGRTEKADRQLHGILNPTFRDAARGRAILKTDRPVVGIVNGSHSQGGYRNWPMRYVERFAELCHDHGWRVAILDDRHYPLGMRLSSVGALNLTGRLTVRELCAVLAAVQVTVSPDTGTFHLAEALGVPVIGYFTTVPPETRSHGYQFARTFYKRLPCSPCFHSPTCGARPMEAECVKAVTPERVFEEAQWMAENPPPYADNRAPLGGSVSPVRWAGSPPMFHVEHPASVMTERA